MLSNFQLVKCCGTCRHRTNNFETKSSDRIICKKFGEWNPETKEILTTFTICIGYSIKPYFSTWKTPFKADEWELFD